MPDYTLILYGNAAAQEQAKELLAGTGQIRLIESGQRLTGHYLFLNGCIKEISLIPLLRRSGIHGFRLVEHDQRSSRKGAPFSL